MTNPMIEKVARAIYEICNDGGPWNDEEWAEMKASDDPRKTGWRSHFLHMARAAIEAMREPTPEMSQAGDDAAGMPWTSAIPPTAHQGRYVVCMVYNAMIDAALREGK